MESLCNFCCQSLLCCHFLAINQCVVYNGLRFEFAGYFFELYGVVKDASSVYEFNELHWFHKYVYMYSNFNWGEHW